MVMRNSPTAKLCEWVCSTRYEDLPAEVRKETVTILYDHVGGMIASATLPSCRPVVDFVRTVGGPDDCTIVGHPRKTSVTNAALANGTISHGDEVDAMGSGGTGHFPATTVPVALTVGEYTKASGKDLVRSLAVGSEVSARFHRIVNHYKTRSQFYAGVAGTMGAVVTAGSLLGLDVDQMENALGLAASGACGLTSFHLEEMHQAKALTLGRIAEAGVLSALLAKEGFHGPKDILTAENGFFDAFLGIPSAGHEAVEGLGEKYAMRPAGYKRYSVGGVDQAALHIFLHLIKEHELIAEEIDQIEVLVTRDAFHTATTNQHPSIHMETILSLAAVYGEITFGHIHDPGYREAAPFKNFRDRARIMVIPRPGHATAEQRLGATVTVRSRSGEVLREQLHYPQMTEEEIQGKFRNLVGRRLESEQVLELERKLKEVEVMEDVAPLISELGLDY